MKAEAAQLEGKKAKCSTSIAMIILDHVNRYLWFLISEHELFHSSEDNRKTTQTPTPPR